MNDAMKYLLELRRLHGACEQAHWDLDAEIDAMALRAVSYDGVRVQTSPEDRMAEYAARVDHATRRLNRAIRRYNAARGKIIHKINQMPENASKLLYLRYVQFRTLSQCAERMDYSYDYIRHMHGTALNQFLEKYRDEIEKELTRWTQKDRR